MQGLRLQPAPRRCSRTQVRRAFNYALIARTSNQQLSNGEYYRINSYFDGIPELACVRAAGGAGTADPRNACATRCRPNSSPRLQKSGRRQSGSGAQQSARSARLLKEAGFEIRDHKLVDPRGQAGHRRIPVQDPADERSRAVLQAVAGALGCPSIDPHRRQRAISEPHPQFRFRHDHRPMGAVAVAGQRAARFLRIAGRGPAGFAQHVPGIKNPAVDALIERIIFAKDRDQLVAAQGAGPRVAVEFLRGPAIRLRLRA